MKTCLRCSSAKSGGKRVKEGGRKGQRKEMEKRKRGTEKGGKIYYRKRGTCKNKSVPFSLFF